MSIHHSTEISKLIDRKRVRVFAEVGVMKSTFCKGVLRRTGGTLREYWAIDQWLELHSDKAAGKDHGRLAAPRMVQEDWDNLYKNCCKLMTWFPVLRVVRLESTEACKLIPDQYFDFVYIDTSHFYEETKEDILAWLPKVRRGGILGGHDYDTPTKKHFGVRRAVDELFPDGVHTMGDMVWWRHV